MLPKNDRELQGFIQGQEILVGTPLKFGLLFETFPNISAIELIVVDEADKMFEMGFLE